MANRFDTNAKLQAIADALGDNSDLVDALVDIATAISQGGGGSAINVVIIQRSNLTYASPITIGNISTITGGLIPSFTELKGVSLYMCQGASSFDPNASVMVSPTSNNVFLFPTINQSNIACAFALFY